MGLLPLHACIILAPLAAASQLRQAKSAGVDGDSAAGWEDMKCFMDLSRFGLTAGKDDVLFRSGHATPDGMPEVLVVQDVDQTSKLPRRTLVFKSADGKCNEQAGTVCTGTSVKPSSLDKAVNSLSNSLADANGEGAFAADAALLSDSGAAALDKCSMLACNADVAATLADRGAGYIRSMVGATSLLPGAPSQQRKFLSIGLGAGTMPLVIQQAFPGSQQTVVELSPDVAAAAQCFGTTSSSGLDIVTGDGRAYLENSADASYDAVFLDAFDALDKVPSCFTTTEFFKTAKRKLRSGGILVMNAHTGKTLHNDVRDIMPAAHAVFGKVQMGVAPGLANGIVLAHAEDSSKAPAAVLAQGANVDISSWFADATFTLYQDTAGQALTDAAVQCQIP